jgi:hypothetical protein
MNAQLNLGLARARHQELVDQATRHRRRGGGWRRRDDGAPPPPLSWSGLTLRLATSADSSALARLADLEQASAPAEPVLLGVVMARPLAALSLSDGSVIADPFAPTAELIELLRLRARQLGFLR